MTSTTQFSMFVTEVEGEDYTYAHCYDEDAAGNELGCGMEYEFYPEGTFEDLLGRYEPGVLRHWHDAVGLVTSIRMTPHEWDELVEWHNRNCGEEEDR